MLIHQLSSFSFGKYEEIKDEFINDTKLMNMIYKLYQNHTTMKLKKIKRILKHDLWWDINKCIQNGLVDKIWKGNNIIVKVKNKFKSKNKVKKIKKVS